MGHRLPASRRYRPPLATRRGRAAFEMRRPAATASRSSAGWSGRPSRCSRAASEPAGCSSSIGLRVLGLLVRPGGGSGRRGAPHRRRPGERGQGARLPAACRPRRADPHVGDAIRHLNAAEGEFDVVYDDIDKDRYPGVARRPRADPRRRPLPVRQRPVVRPRHGGRARPCRHPRDPRAQRADRRRRALPAHHRPHPRRPDGGPRVS